MHRRERSEMKAANVASRGVRSKGEGERRSERRGEVGDEGSNRCE